MPSHQFALIRGALSVCLSVCSCLNVGWQSWGDLKVEWINEEEGSEMAERKQVYIKDCVSDHMLLFVN